MCNIKPSGESVIKLMPFLFHLTQALYSSNAIDVGPYLPQYSSLEGLET